MKNFPSRQMKLWVLFAASLVSGQFRSDILIPVYDLDTGRPKIRATYEFNSQTFIDEQEFCEIDNRSEDSFFAQVPYGQYIEGNIHILDSFGNRAFLGEGFSMNNSRHRMNEVSIGLSPFSRIHEISQNGYMIIPGRREWSSGTTTTTGTLVIDPIDPVVYCEPDSLIYTNRITESYEIYAIVTIVPIFESLSEQISLPQIVYPYQISTRNTSLSFPSRYLNQIYEYLIPGFIAGEGFPTIIDNCDLAVGRLNSNYPTIHFRLMSSFDSNSSTTHVGTIILGPDDYLTVVNDTQCRSLLTVGLPSLGTPFLSKIAVHFQRNTIGFCDPLMMI